LPGGDAGAGAFSCAGGGDGGDSGALTSDGDGVLCGREREGGVVHAHMIAAAATAPAMQRSRFRNQYVTGFMEDVVGLQFDLWRYT
jgi:hypothetical protein